MSAPEPAAAVEVVLWDADGVLQHLPEGMEASMRPVVGHLLDDPADVEAFLHDAWAAERPSLRGEARWVEVLPTVLERWGLSSAYDDALRVWLTIEPVAASRELVAAVRASGVRCYLATNQDEHRARHMHGVMGYADLLDGAFYSYELGAAKPEAAYFTRILERLDVPGERVLFLDDVAANVESARSAGLRAEQWHVRDGVDALRAHLASHGLPTPR